MAATLCKSDFSLCFVQLGRRKPCAIERLWASAASATQGAEGAGASAANLSGTDHCTRVIWHEESRLVSVSTPVKTKK
ncbi:hypothetical protein PCASD_08618 [Puccinia coronata f. sp. avenae]|jgi:hypothetical protein|uniref:Uncharacterized protein n=1 Tax=Puccinia coronata f. sp. avenae TaxID=200324 RepID=A0A2N5UBX0_9BASI|nr:hypothetical protein PCASD_26878 [Puccinia coronata f. sp. avenae]PLW35235.1 hypothetical protein PCASD_08618 [Puccinia coronata f. sp. avenae]